MKAIKCEDGGSLGPKRKKKSAIPMASSVNFGDSGEKTKTPRSCNPNAAPNTAAAGGSGITVNPVVKSSSDAGQKAGKFSSKRQLNRGRVLTAKELERLKEKRLNKLKERRLAL